VAEAATIARPYAKAAFLSARETAALPSWSEALRLGGALTADPRIADLVTNPKMTTDERVSMFAGLGGDAIDPHWQNFIRLLARNKRLDVLPQIGAQYELLRAQYENELDVEVTSAVALDAGQQGKLKDALKRRFSRDVRISMTVDPALLGGAVIRAGDLVIDGSIHGRLQRLKSELGN
jgi:F-type H+-transporting ATPase subunit delta